MADTASTTQVSLTTIKAKQSVQVAWEKLTYDVSTPGGTKRIIKGVSGHASPGQVLAIMGSSGAGKTTLLNLLSGRALTGHLGGTIRANQARSVYREHHVQILHANVMN